VRTGPARHVDATRIRDPARAPTDSARDAYWPALFAALTLLPANISDRLFRDVLGAQSAQACTAGCLALPMPPDVFLNAPANAARPQRLVAALDGSIQSGTRRTSPSHWSASRSTSLVAVGAAEAAPAPD
jgi:hypothetical protein